MAQTSTLNTIILILVSTTLSINAFARPLNVAKPRTYVGELAIESILNDLFIEAIKSTGGPTPGGKGHELINEKTLGEINSGPAPGGKGHAFTLGLGEMNSGPAPGGKGHSFNNAHTLGSGPTEGGKGHAKTLGEINSGPAPGGKGHAFTNARTLGDQLVNSGPSPGHGH